MTATDPAPLVVIDITGGCEQWTITAPGAGEPAVFILDMDDESDEDDRANTIANMEAALELMHGRVDATTVDDFASTLVEQRDDLARLIQAHDDAERDHDRRTARERAARLLTDADVAAILAAHPDA